MKEYKGNINITLNVNGVDGDISINPSDTLLEVLRNKLGLTGVKASCENGDCGTCTVLVDGVVIKSCIMLAVEAIGKEVMTIEGVKDSPIQNAFTQYAAFQCGFCTCGFIMNCHGLINKYPNASEEIIEEWLSSNLCRCTSYEEISKAIKAVINEPLLR